MSIQSISGSTYSYDLSNLFKSINSRSNFDTTQILQQGSKPQGPPPGPPPGQGPSKEDMQTAIDNLQTTNPTLAEKLQKIQDRMDELKESGVSAEEARKTIETEFGKPTDSERQEIDAAMGKTSSSQGNFGFKNSSSSTDLSSYLTDQSSNSSILQLLSQRLAELSQLASQLSQQQTAA